MHNADAARLRQTVRMGKSTFTISFRNVEPVSGPFARPSGGTCDCAFAARTLVGRVGGRLRGVCSLRNCRLRDNSASSREQGSRRRR
ncbi:hypothetical protein R1flu_016890 [Riccia fluitans]|uniref:Uncharacterized protein n=1 Tax=Riccia fluitans TaxID=41844 RepID=A0ABD1YP46_9MARC